MLLDLKHLLIESKQKVPPFLAAMMPDNEKYLDIGGEYLFQLLSIFSPNQEAVFFEHLNFYFIKTANIPCMEILRCMEISRCLSII